MKEIVILSCYPNTDYKENLLNDCVKKLKSLNKDVLIATHYPIPDYIVKKVNYYIYDSNNIDFDYKTIDNTKYGFFEKNQSFILEFANKCHSPALSRIFNLALNFIKHLQYDYFTILETDAEYDIRDLSKIDDIKTQLINQEKNFFFFKIRPYQYPYWEEHGIFEIYETYSFGGYVNKFLEKFYFPTEYNEWVELYNKDYRYQNLEFYVTEFFKTIKDECLILDSFKHEFPNSEVNIITVNDPTGIYYNIDDENTPILFIVNTESKRRRYVIISFECNLPTEIYLGHRNWHISKLDISKYNRDISIIVYEDDNIVARHYYVVSKEYMKKQCRTHRIKLIS